MKFPEIGDKRIDGFPKKVKADWLIEWIADFEDRDDPFEGLLPHSILRYGEYELQDVPTDTILTNEYSYSKNLAEEYSKLSPDTRPPCIFDPLSLCLLDGNHRSQSARMRGECTIKSYVGVLETADPGWIEWNDDWE